MPVVAKAPTTGKTQERQSFVYLQQSTHAASAEIHLSKGHGASPGNQAGKLADFTPPRSPSKNTGGPDISHPDSLPEKNASPFLGDTQEQESSAEESKEPNLQDQIELTPGIMKAQLEAKIGDKDAQSEDDEKSRKETDKKKEERKVDDWTKYVASNSENATSLTSETLDYRIFLLIVYLIPYHYQATVEESRKQSTIVPKWRV